MHRIMLTAVAAALLTACTSAPVDPTTAKAVPAQRLFAHQDAVQPGARLVITRDAGYWASGGCMAKVVIDGKKAARMDTGEVATFWVAPGRHFVGIDGDDQGSGLCAMQMGQQLKEVAADIGEGEIHRFRITGQNGVDIRPSSI